MGIHNLSFQKASHRKVRTGCVQCKKRHVKCDETKPNCKNCLRYPAKCSFSNPVVKLETTPPVASVALPPLQSLPLSQDSDSMQPFSFDDLELLHHWTLSTAASMAPNPALQKAMVKVVPELGMTHGYLMHQLMAVTALHIAYLRPAKSKPYLLRAAHHNNLALAPMRRNLANITQENCHALYAAGHLVVKYAFARDEQNESTLFTSPGGLISEWVSLVRGALSVYDHSLQWLRTGPWYSTIESIVEPTPDLDVNPEDYQYARLLPLFTSSPGGEDEMDMHVCREALNYLRRLLALAADPRQTISRKTVTYFWPAQVPQRYIELISEQRPEALVVLAHYCVMLKAIEGYWFMSNVAQRLLKQVKSQLQNQGGEWMVHITWPMEIVGLS